jgi:hypothetical protein
MTTRDENAAQTEAKSASRDQRDIYPPVNERLKSMAGWFAIGFIVFAIVIQKYSGFF